MAIVLIVAGEAKRLLGFLWIATERKGSGSGESGHIEATIVVPLKLGCFFLRLRRRRKDLDSSLWGRNPSTLEGGGQGRRWTTSGERERERDGERESEWEERRARGRVI